MTIDIDIYRAARAIIDTRGEKASVRAAKMVNEQLEKGNIEGAAVWKKILRVVKEWLGKERSSGTTIH